MEMEDEVAVVGAEEFFSEPETPEPVADEKAPEPEIDRGKEYEEREAALKKREAELNKWNMRIAEREKQLEAAPQKQTEPSGEELPPLSDEASKVLDDWFQKKYGQRISVIDTLFEDTIESELESFASSKGVEPEELRQVLSEAGIQPQTYSRKGFKDAFNAAYDIHRARSFNPESEREKMKEEIIAELKGQGIRIDSIEPSSRVDLEQDAGDYMENEEMSPDEKYHAILKKLRR